MFHFFMSKGHRYCCTYQGGRRIVLGRWDEGEEMPDQVRRRLVAIDPQVTVTARPTVAEGAALYLRYLYRHMRDENGSLRSRYERAKRHLRPFVALLGDMPLDSLLARDLRTVVEAVQSPNPDWHTALPFGWLMAKRPCSWSDTNTRQAVASFILMVSHLECEGLIPRGLTQHLKTFRFDRVARKTREAVLITYETLEIVSQFSSPVVGAMLKLQWQTAMRPGEIGPMRGCDLETREINGKTITVYIPKHHKNTHRGQSRVVPLNETSLTIWRDIAQGISPEEYVFTPLRSVQWWRAKCSELFRKRNKTQAEKVLMKESRRQRRLAPFYTSKAYHHAIRAAIRAARRAGHDVPMFTPYDIRHSRLSEIQANYGWEVARAVAGHASLDATTWYAHKKMLRDLELATSIF